MDTQRQQSAEAHSIQAHPWRERAERAIVVLAIVAVFSVVVMVLNYRFPALGVPHDATTIAQEAKTPGLAYVDALIHIYEAGMTPWLGNDRLWPTVFLDNPQNFQLGELEGVRYAARVLRDNLTRLRTTDLIDHDVEEAFTRLSIGPGSWMLPSAESQYDRGIAALRRYRARLAAGHAHFYPRADNLMELISQLNSLLGGANTRLYNCIGNFTTRLSEEMAGETAGGEHLMQAEVPWTEIDDQFYYARGVAYVYRELMVAVTQDFAPVLNERNAMSLAQSIVRDFLNYAQFEPWYIANGSFGSMWANHPYQLLGLLSQARERARSLNSMLTVTRE